MINNDYVKTAISAAYTSGNEILDAFINNTFVTQKKGENDIETDIDNKSGEVIRNLILDKYPTHQVHLEENELNVENDNEFLWVIDSIAGTIHFDGGLPYFGTDIALLQNNVPILGLHYRPYFDDLYIAYLNEGAFHINKRLKIEKKLKVNTINNSTEGIVLVDSGKTVSDRTQTARIVDKLIPHFRQLDKFSDGHQAGLLGSSSVVGYICNKNDYWDFLAQKVIVEEAGGKTSDFFGNDLNIDSNMVIYSNGILHNFIIELLKDIKD